MPIVISYTLQPVTITDMLAIVKGIVRPTANGTLIVRQATEIAASGITIKAGSCGTLMDFGA